LLVRGAFGFEWEAVRTKFFAVDQIAANIGNERITDEIWAERGAAINSDSCGAREITGGAAAPFNRSGDNSGDPPFCAKDAPGLFGADAVYRCIRAVHWNVESGRRKRILHVRPHRTVVVHDLSNVGAVAANEFSASAVEGQSVLSAAIFAPNFKRARVERKIRWAEFERANLRVHFRDDRSAIPAVGAVNSII
jgi:hypothetical protein